jgi:hypothetical protein
VPDGGDRLAACRDDQQRADQDEPDVQGERADGDERQADGDEP